ncbi:hypothetical protein [Flindersiella endophytica]
MEPEEAVQALQQDQRSRDAVRASSRWGFRILLAWGLLTLVTEPAMALAPFPWLFVPIGVLAVFVAWLAIYANRQKVTARGFGGRYTAVVTATSMLHIAYMYVVFGLGVHNPAAVIPAGWVVAVPLFVGAYVEGRQK